MANQVQKIQERRQAYRRCFMDGEGKLTPDAELVLADLARFCRWYRHQTVISPTSKQTDVPASFQAIGRREVYARVIAHLHTDDADLFRNSEREAINE